MSLKANTRGGRLAATQDRRLLPLKQQPSDEDHRRGCSLLLDRACTAQVATEAHELLGAAILRVAAPSHPTHCPTHP